MGTSQMSSENRTGDLPTGPMEYLRLVTRSWTATMSGLLGVILAVVALWVDTPTLRSLFGVGSVAAFLNAGFQVWRAERDRANELQRGLNTFEIRKPKIRFVQDDLCHKVRGTGATTEDEDIYIGIESESDFTIRNITVTLVDIFDNETGKKQSLNIPLFEMNGGKPIDLHPRERLHYHLAHAVRDLRTSTINSDIVIGSGPIRKHKAESHRLHLVRVRVSAADMQGQSVQYALGVRNGHLFAEPASQPHVPSI
jgi:hypothetical protein